MLTALAHLILACSRSRSLIADSIRDEPENWENKQSGDWPWLHYKGNVIVVHVGFGSSLIWMDWPHDNLKRETGWAEHRLIKFAACNLIARDKAKQSRKFDKALKAALTGDE